MTTKEIIELHKTKLVEHHIIVVRILNNPATKKWWATVVKDAIRIYETPLFDSKNDLLGSLPEYLWTPPSELNTGCKS